MHPSRPRNPLIADVCFKGGYIDAWGRGTLKIINSCKAASLPEPEFSEIDGGILVTIFKNKFSVEQLKKINLNERQINAILYIKQFGSISNQKYQSLNKISKATSTRDLTELVDKFKLLKREGTTGAGTVYVLIGS